MLCKFHAIYVILYEIIILYTFIFFIHVATVGVCDVILGYIFLCGCVLLYTCLSIGDHSCRCRPPLLKAAHDLGIIRYMYVYIISVLGALLAVHL